MKETLFRGKTNSGKWIYGSLVYSDNIQPAIYFEVGKGEVKSFDYAYVKPETVGQFTGLTDKNGVKIFEGDICRDTEDKDMVVSWSKKFASWVLNRKGWAFSHWFGESCNPEDTEVVGNIHDSPELLNP
jgi:uncharacterized phage protein (TIGR01671 family)